MAPIALVVALEVPGVRRFHRYCGHPNNEMLLAAESTDVVRCVDCSENGTNVTIVVMKACGFLPSGPAVLVYDADGRLIDRTEDEGDDGCFQRKWSDVCEARLKWFCTNSRW